MKGKKKSEKNDDGGLLKMFHNTKVSVSHILLKLQYPTQ